MSLERLLSASRLFRFVGTGFYVAVKFQSLMGELGGNRRYRVQAAKHYAIELYHQYIRDEPVLSSVVALDCASKVSTNELRAQEAVLRRDGYSCLLDALGEAQRRWDDQPGYKTLFS